MPSTPLRLDSAFGSQGRFLPRRADRARVSRNRSFRSLRSWQSVVLYNCGSFTPFPFCLVSIFRSPHGTTLPLVALLPQCQSQVWLKRRVPQFLSAFHPSSKYTKTIGTSVFRSDPHLE